MAQAQEAVWLPVLPSFKDFGGALVKGAGAEADKSGKSVGKRFGVALVAGTAAVGAAGLAAGAALYKVGEVFDDVVDTIRVGSGASGKDLDGLVESAKRVGTRVPADFNQIGTVIADVSTRMGLTGETMDKVASQYLEAGRILGEEVDVGKTSAAFNAFGIEGDKVSGALDHLFQVSQATGLGMNEIADAAARNAPAMETLGFSFEETTAMVGSFDKAGLNSSQIMASMSKGLVTLAKDGEQPADAFKRVQGEISGFIESGDEAAALNLASEVFGTRGATQFIGALKDGALNLEDMSKAGGQTGDTILGLGEETMDFAEQWQLFKNNILVWLEPMGARVFGALGTLMGEVTDGVTAFGNAWKYNDGEVTSSGIPGVMERLGFYARQTFDYIKFTAIPALQEMGKWLMDNKNTIGIVAGVIGTLLLPAFVRMGARALISAGQTVAAFVMAKVSAIGAGATFVLQSLKIVGAWVLMGAQSLFHAARMAAAWLIAMGPIGWIIAAVVGLVAIVILNWDKISKFTSEAWANIVKWVTDAWANIKTGVSSAIEWVRAWIDTKMKQVSLGWRIIWDTIRNKVTGIWTTIKTSVLNAIEYVRSWIDTKMKQVLLGWRIIWDAIKQKASDIWTGIKTTIFNAIEWVRNWIATKVDNIKTNWSNVWNAVKQKASDIWTGIKNTIKDVWEKGIKPTFDTVMDVIKNKVPDAFKKGVDSIKEFWNKLKSIASKPVAFVINTVIRDGLVGGFNKIARFLKIGELTPPPFFKGFAGGGYTGRGGKYDPAGIVHKGEVVFSQDDIRRHGGVSAVEKMRRSGAAGGSGDGAGWSSLQENIKRRGSLYLSGASNGWDFPGAAAMWNGIGNLAVRLGRGNQQGTISHLAQGLNGNIGRAFEDGGILMNTSYRDQYSAAVKRAIAAHEIGHVLGMKHNNAASIMNTWVANGQHLQPTARDRAWIRARYGSAAKTARAGLIHPLPGYPVTSPYGPRSGLNTPGNFHDGIDFGAPTGTPIKAAGSGHVEQAGWGGMAGNFVKLQHAGGLETLYYHMNNLAVRVGQQIDAGRKIGGVGSTGNSTGAHLHYIVRKDGRHVNPAAYLNGGGEVGSGGGPDLFGMLGKLLNIGDLFKGFGEGGGFIADLASGVGKHLVGSVKDWLLDKLPIGEGGPNPYLHDNGGVLNPGLSMILNNTRKPEAIYNHEQNRALQTLAARGAQSQQVPAGITVEGNVYGANAHEIYAVLETKRRREMAMANISQGMRF